MKILIVYDTFYGNTQKVAERLRDNLKDFNPDLIKVDVLTQEQITNTDVFIVGSPTRAFTMTAKIKKALKKNDFQDKFFFAFDTRANIADITSKFLLKMINKFGYAAEKIESRLINKGAKKLIDYKGYFVKDSEGPLYQEVNDQIKEHVTLIIEEIRKLT